jgi:hypothetical protein
MILEKILNLFTSELKVINVGLELFKDELKKQGVKVAHVAWEPLPKMEKEYEDILSKIL